MKASSSNIIISCVRTANALVRQRGHRIVWDFAGRKSEEYHFHTNRLKWTDVVTDLAYDIIPLNMLLIYKKTLKSLRYVKSKKISNEGYFVHNQSENLLKRLRYIY